MRLRVFPLAFKTTFGITAGVAAAYVCLQIFVGAINDGLPADAVRELRHEWQNYREWRTERTPKDSTKTGS